MKLSIVTSLYFSEAYIREFFERIGKASAEITPNSEYIFVNDGSPDNSLEVALELQRQDDRVVVIDLSRNFGHHHALMTGLEFAVGELVFMIDVDLEEEPELLGEFYARLRETQSDSIYGVQLKRKGGTFERLSGALFYWLFHLLSGLNAPKNSLTARLMTRRFVDGLLQHREREVDLMGLLHSTGFYQVPIVVKKHAKPETTYTLYRKLGLAFKAITSFSRRPLIIVFALGTIIMFVSIGMLVFYFFIYIVSGQVPSGFTSIILSIWMLGGLTIFSVGLVALYISVVFNEVKARPLAIIKDVYRSGNHAESTAQENPVDIKHFS